MILRQVNAQHTNNWILRLQENQLAYRIGLEHAT